MATVVEFKPTDGYTERDERTARIVGQYNDADPFVCIVRARAVTESFAENDGAPAIIKKARAFKKICQRIPVRIYDDELIVGASGAHRRSAGVSPEISWQWIRDELPTIDKRDQDPYTIDPAARNELMETILPFWKGRSIEEAFLARLPEQTAVIAVDTGIVDNDSKWRCAVGEVTPDYADILFKKGFAGIISDARRHLADLDLTTAGDIDKANFYHAAITCAEGIIELGQRYAREAGRLAETAVDPERQAELLRIAENCRRVPGHPPENFWQAVQMLWLVQLGNALFENAVALNIGRFDQFMFPFYQRDLESGAITPKEAQTLINCLWVKLSEWIWFVSKNTASYFAGYNAFQNLTVGGRKTDGTDGTNDLTFMCLAATNQVRSHQPGLSVRIHPDCPPELLYQVCELVREGTGFPAIHNDRVGAQMLTAVGLSPEDAMDWSNCGCVVPHSRKISEWTSACNINLAAGVEFVLTNGVSRIHEKPMGLATGGLETLIDFATVKENYFRQLAHMIRHGVTATLVAQQVQAELAPRPFFSLFTEGCMESGCDLVQGGARYRVGPVLTGIGIADTANALAAIKTLIFDEKTTDMATLTEALEKNWAGYEDLRQKALACPKFGNDDDRVDHLAIEISDFYHREISRYRDIYGACFNSAFMGISNYIPAGKAVGATPCGRHSGDPLTEGCSPHAGTDTTSPTAAMRSTAKINHGRHSGGTLLNIKLSPETLRTRQGLNKLAALIRGYFELDAFHVQFNVFDRETLLAAQQTPEAYKHLLVRVAGYSARFVTLSREVQDAIIQRTAYENF
ncbi:dehydrogenase [Desulfosarcina ovata subsp. sediminis]|uniref:Dehydrogenase n=1 Tax=Desulfosarcina ovata subsp. sediminis TaxID=885957 RepID=A0A5K7ZXU5_9BACT|nr:pyruvate formate lyase family protein [Desulfosarcina ovata]BBO85097.1 dehydrogenase [Desulfosarcina ovata subsp. sediminis]